MNELNSVSEQLKRPRNIDFISLQQKRIETELTNLRDQLRSEESQQTAPKASADSASTTKRYECEITNYAWDQSDKFVKLFVVLNGVQNLGEDNVAVTFTENSVHLKITGLDNKDHVFAINNLLNSIDVTKSYRKVKTDTIAIYAKKSQEGKHLTLALLCTNRIQAFFQFSAHVSCPAILKSTYYSFFFEWH